MTDAAPLDRMQQMADYRTTCKFLKRSGQQGVVFGCAFLLTGATILKNDFIDYLYICLAFLVLLNGIRNWNHPSAIGVFLDGFSLLSLGILQLSMQALIATNGVDPSLLRCLIGVIAVLVGLQRFWRYPRSQRALHNQPTAEQIAWFDAVVMDSTKRLRQRIPTWWSSIGFALGKVGGSATLVSLSISSISITW